VRRQPGHNNSRTCRTSRAAGPTRHTNSTQPIPFRNGPCEPASGHGASRLAPSERISSSTRATAHQGFSTRHAARKDSSRCSKVVSYGPVGSIPARDGPVSIYVGGGGLRYVYTLGRRPSLRVRDRSELRSTAFGRSSAPELHENIRDYRTSPTTGLQGVVALSALEDLRLEVLPDEGGRCETDGDPTHLPGSPLATVQVAIPAHSAMVHRPCRKGASKPLRRAAATVKWCSL
jgi:hypothetical protein